jgi:hypothetical protein
MVAAGLSLRDGPAELQHGALAAVIPFHGLLPILNRSGVSAEPVQRASLASVRVPECVASLDQPRLLGQKGLEGGNGPGVGSQCILWASPVAQQISGSGIAERPRDRIRLHRGRNRCQLVALRQGLTTFGVGFTPAAQFGQQPAQVAVAASQSAAALEVNVSVRGRLLPGGQALTELGFGLAAPAEPSEQHTQGAMMLLEKAVPGALRAEAPGLVVPGPWPSCAGTQPHRSDKPPLSGIQCSTLSPGVTAPSNADAYTVVATFTSSDSNYTSGGSAQTTFTINPLAVTLSGSRTYDGTTTAPASILSITNLVNGDNVTGNQSGNQLGNLVAVLLDLLGAGVDVPPEVPLAFAGTRSLEVEDRSSW